MSNVSSVHDIIPFVAGKTTALTGQRLAKIGYKSTKKNPAKFRSVAVSVPHIDPEHIRENLTALLPYIGTMLENTQDAIIRTLYENKDGTLATVQDHEISAQACISYLEAEAAGERLKKEHIEAWFDRVCADNVFTLVAEKIGYGDQETLTSDQEKTVAKHVKIYRELMSSLSGGNVRFTPLQISSCITVLEVSEDDSGIGSKLRTRLENLAKPPKTEDFLAL